VIRVEQIEVGDLLVLGDGECVPADCVLLKVGLEDTDAKQVREAYV